MTMVKKMGSVTFRLKMRFSIKHLPFKVLSFEIVVQKSLFVKELRKMNLEITWILCATVLGIAIVLLPVALIYS